MQRSSEEYPGVPRWVKISALVVALLLVILVVALALAGGHQGPGRHLPSGDNHALTTGIHGEGHRSASPAAEGAFRIEVIADQLKFDPPAFGIAAGTDVAIILTSIDTLHDFTIDELGAHVAADAGETAIGGFRADPPGEYVYYCAVPGHREAGMEGILTVEAPERGHGADHRPSGGGRH